MDTDFPEAERSDDRNFPVMKHLGDIAHILLPC
jgi:hypothetical protein